MNNVVIAVLAITILSLSILCCIKLGHSYAIWEEKRAGKKRTGTQITEGAVFALLGLLVAFTFSGAADKFDKRRAMIISEANAIETAYLSLDLLQKPTVIPLQNDFRAYLDARLEIYKNLSNPKLFQSGLARTNQLQQKIWNSAVSSCMASHPDVTCTILLPNLTAMYNIANTRIANLQVHPHVIVYVLLIGISLLSASLAGYSISREYVGSSLHMMSYAFVVALIIYIVIDMEHPRKGLIRVDAFDKTLSELRVKMPLRKE